MDFFSDFSLLWSYLLFINVLTFVVFAFDKWMARIKAWRTREVILWGLAFLGGSIGALCSMHLFRHKTKKLSFQLILALVIVLQLGLIYVGYQIFSDYGSSATLQPYG